MIYLPGYRRGMALLTHHHKYGKKCYDHYSHPRQESGTKPFNKRHIHPNSLSMNARCTSLRDRDHDGQHESIAYLLYGTHKANRYSLLLSTDARRGSNYYSVKKGANTHTNNEKRRKHSSQIVLFRRNTKQQQQSYDHHYYSRYQYLFRPNACNETRHEIGHQSKSKL